MSTAEAVKRRAKEIWGAVGYLLQYPTVEWWSTLPEWEAFIETIEDTSSKDILTEFLTYLHGMDKREFEDQYVRLFDFSKDTTLNLSSHECTDPEEQAAELIGYKEFFLRNGYDISYELPDYVPAILELAGVLSPAEAVALLQYSRPKLELLRGRLVEAKAPYAVLIEVVLTVLQRLEEQAHG